MQGHGGGEGRYSGWSVQLCASRRVVSKVWMGVGWTSGWEACLAPSPNAPLTAPQCPSRQFLLPFASYQRGKVIVDQAALHQLADAGLLTAMRSCARRFPGPRWRICIDRCCPGGHAILWSLSRCSR